MLKVEWKERYRGPSLLNWQGRHDGPNALRYHEVVRPINLTDTPKIEGQGNRFAIVGFACDEGIRRNQGRAGAAEGPSIIRQALSILPLHCHNIQVYDVGDIICTDEDLEQSQLALGAVVSSLISQNIKPIVLGGGHEVAWGHYQGVVDANPKKELGIVNFDAHYDMRPLLEGDLGSSGTSFLQMAKERESKGKAFDYTCIGIQKFSNTPALIEEANRRNTLTISAEDLHLQGIEEPMMILDTLLQRRESIFMSVCMDVFARPYSPGVSAPQVLGLTPWQVIPLLRILAQSKKVAAFNIAELCPRLDVGGTTASLAAALIAEYIQHG